MTETLRIDLLGEPRVTRGGQNIALEPSSQPAQILFILAAEPRRQARSAIIAALWHEGPSPAARHRLSQELRRLRWRLGEPRAAESIIRAGGDDLWLDADRCAVDLWTWREAAARALAAPAVDSLRAALAALGRGLLPGLPAGWLAPHRQAAARDALAMTHALARVLAAQRRTAEAAEVLERALAADPGCQVTATELGALRNRLAAESRRLAVDAGVDATDRWLEAGLDCLREDDPGGAMLRFVAAWQADGRDGVVHARRLTMTAAAAVELAGCRPLGAPIRQLVVAPGDRFLAATLAGGELAIWADDPSEPTRLALSGEPMCLVVDPRGRHLAVGLANGEVDLVAVAGCRRIATIRVGDGRVQALAFTAAGDALAAGTVGGELRVCRLDGGAFAFAPHRLDRVQCLLAAGDDEVIAGLTSGEVVFLDTCSGRPRGRPLRHAAPVNALDRSPDGRLLATACGDGTAHLWDLTTREPAAAPLATHTRTCHVARFAGGGRWLVSGGADGQLIISEVATRRAVGPPRTVWSNHAGLASAPCGDRLLAWSADGQLLVADLPDWRPAARLTVDGLTAVAWRADNRRFVAASRDGTVRSLAWPPAVQRPPSVARHGRGHLSAVAWHPSGRIVSAGADGRARWWEADELEPVAEAPHEATVWCARFSPDGRWLATGGADGRARLWTATTGRPAGAWLAAAGSIRSLSFSADSARLAAGGRPGSVVVWTVPDGVRLAEYATGDDGPAHAALTPDGRRLAVGDWMGYIHAVDLADGRRLARRHAHVQRCYGCAALADGDRALTWGDDGRAEIWRLDDGGRLVTVTTSAGIHHAALLAGDELLATAGCDGVVRLWRTATGEPVSPPRRHRQWALSVAVSPDGRWLASTGDEGDVWLWEVPGLRCLGPPLVHPSHVFAAAFSPDGGRLATVCCDGTVRLWPLPAGHGDAAFWARRAVDSSGRYVDATGALVPAPCELLGGVAYPSAD